MFFLRIKISDLYDLKEWEPLKMIKVYKYKSKLIKEKTIKKNINIDYIYSFMKNFDISRAIWVLYMVYKGLPLWQIGIVEGVFHLTSFLFEVPSGAAADLFGRKKVMIAGRICSVVSSVINLFAVNLFGFSIGFMISALGYNLNSGSEEALVYDTLKQEDCEKEYLKVSSRLNLIIEISQGLATFIGGVLAQYSYVYCYGMAIIISLLSLIPCCMFKEPSIKDENKRKEKVSIKMHFRICYEIFKTNKKIIKVIVYFPLVFTFHTVVYFYGQQYFSTLGCNKIEISFIMFFGGISSCIGALSCEKITYVFKDKTRYVASALMGISIVFISGKILSVSIIFFGVMNYVNALLYPIQSEALNELIPSEQRATIISIDSMIFSFSMICMFPLCGLFADKFNLHITFFVLGIIQI